MSDPKPKRRYAENTSVSVEQSQAQIQRLVKKYGAGKFGIIDAEDEQQFIVAFQMRSRMLRFTLNTPDREALHPVKSGYRGTEMKPLSETAYQKELARLFRALKLTIQARLESIESGIETFDQAFMANIVVPDKNVTVGEWITSEELDRAYAGGALPRLLPG